MSMQLKIVCINDGVSISRREGVKSPKGSMSTIKHSFLCPVTFNTQSYPKTQEPLYHFAHMDTVSEKLSSFFI